MYTIGRGVLSQFTTHNTRYIINICHKSEVQYNEIIESFLNTNT